MKFFKSLWKSLYDVSYYHHEGQQYTFWKAVWRYMRIFFLVFFILGTIGLILFSHLFTKENITKRTASARTVALQAYPSGLVMDISAGSGVTTNTTGPVILSRDMVMGLFSGMNFMNYMPNRMNSESTKRKKEVTIYGNSYDPDQLNQYQNILVIDPSSTGDIESYHTLALLTNTQLIIQAKTNEKRVYEVASSMQGKPPVHITQASTNAGIENVASTITTNAGKITGIAYAIVAIMVLIVLIIGSFFVGLFTAIALYLYALIVRLVSKILKTNYTYKQVYSMSALGFTLPFLLIFSSTWLRLIVLCVIVGRVMYLHKQRNAKKA